MSTNRKHSNTISWEDPPERQYRKSKAKGRAALSFPKRTMPVLEKRPGEWARVAVRPTRGSLAYHSQALRKAGAEASVRRIGENSYGLWARVPAE